MSERFKDTIYIRIETNLQFTDSRIVEYMNSKSSYSIDEYRRFIISLGTIHNENAKQIIDFFSNYKGGIIQPTRCDTAEPIREKFDPNKLETPINWLSQPGGVYLKRTKKLIYEAVIENYQSGTSWIGNILVKPIKPPQIYGSIEFYIDNKRQKVERDFLVEMIKDIKKIIKTTNCYITEDGEKENI